MDKKYITDTVESILNGENIELDYSLACFGNTSVESFMRNTVDRLLKTYHHFCDDVCSRYDLLVSLRNYLLVYEISVKIDGFEIPDKNPFGLFKEYDSGRYYASYVVPEFIERQEFIKTAYINESSQLYSVNSGYCLATNRFIKNLTDFDSFKSMEQKLCVYGAINTPNGYTTLVSMPTGGGKSLVTQSLAYSSEGLSIVVVPTVSLALDQERVAKKNIKIAKNDEVFSYYSGANNINDIAKAIEKNKARLLFISPEALIKNSQFKDMIDAANKKKLIKNLIIDEAHIVVAWGDFFRVDYQCLAPWRKALMSITPEIRTFLLSATYRDDTVRILKRLFAVKDRWIELRCDSLRKEPRYILEKVSNSHIKKKRVLNLVNILPRPIILYVNAPFEAVRWKSYLEENGYRNIKLFTGETGSEDRRKLIFDWTNNEFDIMIATSAFGVGVDKPDVRSVVHLYVPENADSYYQELGRGGRDGLPCLSVMCIEDDDISLGSKHLPKVLRDNTFWGRWWSMYTNPQNLWQGNTIAVMASTKPNYNKINYFEEGNDTDEKWNINVLLLLCRYQQIEIVALDMDEQNRYIFTIRILNDLITENSSRSKELFMEIRDKESAKAKNAFNLIKNAIYQSKSICWSGMFNNVDTYALVSECCPGCNEHESFIVDEVNRFPLLVDVKSPAKELSLKMKQFFGGTNEALIISKEARVSLANKYQPDIIVSDDLIACNLIENAKINQMNYAEFRDLLVHDNDFYISGLVMVIYSENDDIARKQYQIVNKYLNKERHVIHVANEDFVISKTSGKQLSNQISGTVIRS